MKITLNLSSCFSVLLCSCVTAAAASLSLLTLLTSAVHLRLLLLLLHQQAPCVRCYSFACESLFPCGSKVSLSSRKTGQLHCTYLFPWKNRQHFFVLSPLFFLLLPPYFNQIPFQTHTHKHSQLVSSTPPSSSMCLLQLLIFCESPTPSPCTQTPILSQAE